MALLGASGFEREIPESGIVGVGLALAIVGLLFRDAFGLTSLLLAIGIGLVIAGTVYVAAEGPEPVRIGLAFVALVAAQLVAVGDVGRGIGWIGVGVVVLGIAVTRL